MPKQSFDHVETKLNKRGGEKKLHWKGPEELTPKRIEKKLPPRSQERPYKFSITVARRLGGEKKNLKKEFSSLRKSNVRKGWEHGEGRRKR